jgi:hypothetical protein
MTTTAPDLERLLKSVESITRLVGAPSTPSRPLKKSSAEPSLPVYPLSWFLPEETQRRLEESLRRKLEIRIAQEVSHTLSRAHAFFHDVTGSLVSVQDLGGASDDFIAEAIQQLAATQYEAQICRIREAINRILARQAVQVGGPDRKSGFSGVR